MPVSHVFDPVRLLDEMPATLPFIRSTRRVGVVGLFQSGKTTFLTSLIAHLRSHDPAHLHLGTGVDVYPPVELAAEEGFEAFAFEAHRARLAREHRWPEKTAAVAQYRADLTVKVGASERRTRLSLLDCPGERLADLPMAGRSFGEWSEWMLEQLRSPQNRGHAAEFLALVETHEADAEALLAAYRRTLARLALAYTPIVSPSFFVLDEGGEEIPAAGRSVEWIAANRAVGLDKDNQFAPMNAEHRARRPELERVFGGRFDAYRAHAVTPLAKWLKRSHHLVVLVDVSMILAGGLGMLRSHAALIDQILAYTDPGFGSVGEWARRATAAFGVPLAGVRKITFVAAKADKVHPDDRVRLDGLLRQLVRPSVRRHEAKAEHLDIEYLICSAIKSTGATKDGRLVGGLPGAGESSFSVSRVPEAWPAEDWPAYRFTGVDPKFPSNELYPPPHSGMHLAAKSILGLD
ncbi:MAG: YcjX family protein [Phycisphaerales bacterium]